MDHAKEPGILVTSLDMLDADQLCREAHFEVVMRSVLDKEGLQLSLGELCIATRRDGCCITLETKLLLEQFVESVITSPTIDEG